MVNGSGHSDKQDSQEAVLSRGGVMGSDMMAINGLYRRYFCDVFVKLGMPFVIRL